MTAEKKDVWGDNSIQFPRILAELQGLVTFDQMRELSELTDLSERELEEIFERAIRAWEDIKSDARWEGIEQAQEQHDRMMAQEQHAISLEKLLEQYGPAKLIDRTKADELCKAGEWSRVLCVHRTSEDVLYGSIGFHVVDVDERYELGKPVPETLTDVYGCAGTHLLEET